MSRAFTPGLIAASKIRVERIRELAVPGEISVKKGDLVHADDIVATAKLSGDLYILRLPERMGLEIHEVLEGLSVEEGESVTTGQVLCEKSALFGLLTARFEAPQDGVIEFIAKKTGHVGLRLPPQEISLDAYISGEVVQINESKSVTIANELCFIQGIFGVGGERKGKLHLLDIDPDAVLKESHFQNSEKSLKGSVCVGGSRPTIKALWAARDAGIAALICGSIDDEVLSEFLGYELGIALTGDEDIPFTIIVTEGFGELSLSSRVLTPLSGLEGALCSVNGKTQVRAGAVRPELIVSLEEHKNLSRDIHERDLTLDLGSEVRLIRVPYFGKFASVVELPAHEEEIPTGAHTRVLRAKLKESGEIVTVPRANVELI